MFKGILRVLLVVITKQAKQRGKPMITKEMYMQNSTKLHHEYFAQFVLESTKKFVLSRFTLEQLLASKDFYLNDLEVPHYRGGGWWWDNAPLNMELMREIGEVSKGYLPSKASHTCVGKAAARMIIRDALAAMNQGVNNLEQDQ